MLTEELKSVVERGFASVWEDVAHGTDKKVAVAQNRAAQQGMLASSPLMKKIKEIFEEGLERAFDLAWDNLVRAVEAFGVSPAPGLVDELTAFVTSMLRPLGDTYDERLREYARNKGFKPKWTVSGKLDRLGQRASAEAQLLVQKLPRTTGSPRENQAVTVLSHILLDREQDYLLGVLVEAARTVPRDERRKFTVSGTIGNVQPEIIHPGLSQGTRAPLTDVEILDREGLAMISRTSQGDVQFDLTPLGYRYYEELKRRSGQPVERIEKEIRAFLDASAFRERYPSAYKQWMAAEEDLWSADSRDQFTTIGHKCRGVMQQFAESLIQTHRPHGASPDAAQTVSRVRSVLDQKSEQIGKTRQEFLGALLAYWGTLNDLVQRLEHGAAREGKPVTWEDARVVVFHTAICMLEISRAVDVEW